MTKPKLYLLGCLLILIVTTLLLLTGSSILSMPLFKGSSIPMGTPITWIGLISLPLSIYFGISKFREPTHTLYKYLGPLLTLSLFAAFLWVPISYVLAGNLSFSFSEKEGFQGGQSAMKWFWGYSYAVVILPLALLVMHWIWALAKGLKK